MKDRRISKLIKNSILNLLYHAVLFGTINSLIWRTAVKRTMKDVLEDHKTRPLPTDPWARAAPLPMNEYGYPLFVAYKRQRMWVTRAISATLTSLASTLLGMSHPTFAADSAVTREFEVFRSNAGFSPLGLLLFLFATDMLLQGLKVSTADTYVNGILRCRAHANQKSTDPFVSDVKNFWRRFH